MSNYKREGELFSVILNLFLRRCDKNWEAKTLVLPHFIWPEMRCIIWNPSVSPVHFNVCVINVSRERQAGHCMDKTSFVRRSRAGRVVPLLTAWGHLLTRSLLLMLPSLCICLCLVLRQWSDWLSGGCLSVCRITLLSRVLYRACLPFAAAVHPEFISVDQSIFELSQCLCSAAAAWCYRYWQTRYL